MAKVATWRRVPGKAVPIPLWLSEQFRQRSPWVWVKVFAAMVVVLLVQGLGKPTILLGTPVPGWVVGLSWAVPISTLFLLSGINLGLATPAQRRLRTSDQAFPILLNIQREGKDLALEWGTCSLDEDRLQYVSDSTFFEFSRSDVAEASADVGLKIYLPNGDVLFLGSLERWNREEDTPTLKSQFRDAASQWCSNLAPSQVPPVFPPDSKQPLLNSKLGVFHLAMVAGVVLPILVAFVAVRFFGA